jgi:hypothetical protein
MKTEVASVFCEAWCPLLEPPPDKGLRAIIGKSNSNEKKNEAVSIG